MQEPALSMAPLVLQQLGKDGTLQNRGGVMHKLLKMFCVAGLFVAEPVLAGSLALGSEVAIAYGPDDAQKLDICTPADSRGPFPAMLMIHGGGLVAGSRTKQAGLCKMFADSGIVAIPVDYRLYARTDSTRWPVQFNDVQLAMRWVRSHAAEYNIDPSHICAMGDSSGAQLALLLGMVPTVDPGDTQGLLRSVSPAADCVASVSGITDVVALAPVLPGVLTVLRGPGAMDPARLRAAETNASAALRVHRGAPPALLIHGLEDKRAPFSQATEMQAALLGVGSQSWLVAYEGGHELSGLQGGGRIRAVWELVGEFVKARRLPGASRQVSISEIFANLP